MRPKGNAGGVNEMTTRRLFRWSFLEQNRRKYMKTQFSLSPILYHIFTGKYSK